MQQAPSHPLFEAHPKLWAELSASVRKKELTSSEFAFAHGDRADAFWLVTSGWIKLSRQTPDGKETIVGLCSAGDIFGEASLFSGACYPYSAEAIGEGSRLLLIPSEKLRAVVQQNAEISASIMAMLSERMQGAQLKLEQINTMSAAQRLGCFFLSLCRHQPSGERVLEIPVEKHVLAAYLGMKPETLSRSLQQLKSIGVLGSGVNIRITNVAALQQFVCGSCSESGSCEAEGSAANQ